MEIKEFFEFYDDIIATITLVVAFASVIWASFRSKPLDPNSNPQVDLAKQSEFYQDKLECIFIKICQLRLEQEQERHDLKLSIQSLVEQVTRHQQPQSFVDQATLNQQAQMFEINEKKDEAQLPKRSRRKK